MLKRTLVGLVGGALALTVVTAGGADGVAGASSSFGAARSESPNGTVYDASAVATDDAYAVGHFSSPRGDRLLAHWNGAMWKPTGPAASQLPGLSLRAVTADSPSDVWAVGGSASYQPLIEHWDGHRWRQSTGNAKDVVLHAVSAKAADDVWIGGETKGERAEAEHWDGSSWSTVQLPTRVTKLSYSSISAVSALTSSDVWLLGTGVNTGGRLEAFALHRVDDTWDMTVLPTELDTSSLTMSVVSDTDVWMSGLLDNTVLHWDGHQWQAVATGTPPGQNATVASVTAIAADDVWAMGESLMSQHPTVTEPFAEHWDGSTWTSVDIPLVHGRTNLVQSSTATSTDDVWAVGGTRNDKGITWHWDGTTWSSVRT